MAGFGDYVSNPALTRRMNAAGLGQAQPQAQPQLGTSPAAPVAPLAANPVATNQESYNDMAGRINRYMAVPYKSRDPYGRGDLEGDIGRGSFSPEQQAQFQGLFNPAPAQPMYVGSAPPSGMR